MADDNMKYPNRIAKEITTVNTTNHFTRDHIENQPIKDILRHTPSGEVLANVDAESLFYKSNPPREGETAVEYNTRMANAWSEKQGGLSTLKMQDFYIKDFTEHQLEDSGTKGRPGSTNSNDKRNIGFFGGSSTVTKYPSVDGTVPHIPNKETIKRIASPGHTRMSEPSKVTRNIVEAVGLHKAEDNVDHKSGNFNVNYDKKPTKDDEGKYSTANIKVPISPIYPFTRMEPEDAHETIFMAYNRNKIPIADVEHRKAFRHLFFGRPECYIFGMGGKISDQCKNDPDFSSTLSRMPHVLAMLSPVYCTGALSYIHADNKQMENHCNWNYLLSNRVKGLNVTGNSIGIDESMTKSLSEYTIIPGGTDKGNLSQTLSLSFTDTKRLELYEFIRMWMLYIHKRKRGIFDPSMNYYNPSNTFPDMITKTKPKSAELLNGHIYNRALDYCAPLFDIVTDETMTNVLYWCKYYGLYPVSVTNSGLSNAEGTALTEQMTVDVEFRYQARKENMIMNLVEFNYNAGIVNEVGKLRDEIEFVNSSPFLYRKDDRTPIRNHMGAAGMFTGAPYIIMEQDIKRIPITKRLYTGTEQITSSAIPQLRFMNLSNEKGKILHAQSVFANTLTYASGNINTRKPIGIS